MKDQHRYRRGEKIATDRRSSEVGEKDDEGLLLTRRNLGRSAAVCMSSVFIASATGEVVQAAVANDLNVTANIPSGTTADLDVTAHYGDGTTGTTSISISDGTKTYDISSLDITTSDDLSIDGTFTVNESTDDVPEITDMSLNYAFTIDSIAIEVDANIPNTGEATLDIYSDEYSSTTPVTSISLADGVNSYSIPSGSVSSTANIWIEGEFNITDKENYDAKNNPVKIKSMLFVYSVNNTSDSTNDSDGTNETTSGGNTTDSTNETTSGGNTTNTTDTNFTFDEDECRVVGCKDKGGGEPIPDDADAEISPFKGILSASYTVSRTSARYISLTGIATGVIILIFGNKSKGWSILKISGGILLLYFSIDVIARVAAFIGG